MKTNKKSLSIVLFALIAVIVLGVGYAAITAINLTINGNATATPNQENFTVKFASTPISSTNAANVTVDSDLIAHFDTSGLTKQGDETVVTFTIQNSSPDLKADLVVNSTNTNSEYFEVTNTFGNSDTSIQLTAGATTTVTVKVKVLKTPISADQYTTVVTTITASPNNN